ASRPGSLLGNATDQGLIGAALTVLLLPRLVAALRTAFVARDPRLRGAALLDHFAATVTLALAVLAGTATVLVSASRAGLLALGVGLCVVVAAIVVERARSAGARAAWATVGYGDVAAAVLAAFALV